jgi:hypothetical protein
MQMAGVPHDQYDAVAHVVRPFLEGFAADGSHTVDWFESQIRDRAMQCWIGGDGALRVVCLTEIGTDDLKTCHVSYCGGPGFRDWVGLIGQIALWAKEIGCGRVRVTCRPGYRDFLTQHAFKQSHIVMDRDL